jgi:AcrR family transcriptional regulator
MSTKQKILETALQLFNQEGVSQVTTNHIATAHGISPGNLYYHYRNKEDIIRALFSEFDTITATLYTLPSDRQPNLSDLEQLLEANFAVQWRYRFLFRNLIGLLNRDPELETVYRLHRQRGFEGTLELIRIFSDSGTISTIQNDTDLDVRTRLIWLVSDFWLPSLELGGEATTPETFRLGIALLRHIVR